MKSFKIYWVKYKYIIAIVISFFLTSIVLNVVIYFIKCILAKANKCNFNLNFENYYRINSSDLFFFFSILGTIFLFRSVSDKDKLRKRKIKKELRFAIVENEFEVVYQPQYNAKNLELRGYEALLRWNSKKLGIVSPDEFIKVAEETGQINLIGEWVLNKACMQNKVWLDNGISKIISINVSALQFENDNFINTVKNTLEVTKLPPELLELEITESRSFNINEKNIGKFDELKSLGIKIALDDFGTGYSSIKYLKIFPFSNLKIDKSLIDDLCSNKNTRSIVNGIIKVAKEINMNITVEGIEHRCQLELLSEMNCDHYQGYYFNRPLKKSDLEKEVLKIII